MCRYEVLSHVALVTGDFMAYQALESAVGQADKVVSTQVGREMVCVKMATAVTTISDMFTAEITTKPTPNLLCQMNTGQIVQ